MQEMYYKVLEPPLKALGALFEQKSREEQGQMLATVGTIIQATGANLNAVLISFDHMNSD